MRSSRQSNDVYIKDKIKEGQTTFHFWCSCCENWMGKRMTLHISMYKSFKSEETNKDENVDQWVKALAPFVDREICDKHIIAIDFVQSPRLLQVIEEKLGTFYLIKWVYPIQCHLGKCNLKAAHCISWLEKNSSNWWLQQPKVASCSSQLQPKPATESDHRQSWKNLPKHDGGVHIF